MPLRRSESSYSSYERSRPAGGSARRSYSRSRSWSSSSWSSSSRSRSSSRPPPPRERHPLEALEAACWRGDAVGAMEIGRRVVAESQGRHPRGRVALKLVTTCARRRRCLGGLVDLLRAQKALQQQGSLDLLSVVAAVRELPRFAGLEVSEVAVLVDALCDVARVDPEQFARQDFLGGAAPESALSSPMSSREARVLDFARSTIKKAVAASLKESRSRLADLDDDDDEDQTILRLVPPPRGRRPDELEAEITRGPRPEFFVGEVIGLAHFSSSSSSRPPTAAAAIEKPTKNGVVPPKREDAKQEALVVLEEADGALAAAVATAAKAEAGIRDVEERRRTEMGHSAQLRAYHEQQTRQQRAEQAQRVAQLDQWIASTAPWAWQQRAELDAAVARERSDLADTQTTEAAKRRRYAESLDESLQVYHANRDNAKIALNAANAAYDHARANLQRLEEDVEPSSDNMVAAVQTDEEDLSSSPPPPEQERSKPLPIVVVEAEVVSCPTRDDGDAPLYLRLLFDGKASVHCDDERQSIEEDEVLKRLVGWLRSEAPSPADAAAAVGRSRSTSALRWRVHRLATDLDHALETTCIVAAAALWEEDRRPWFFPTRAVAEALSFCGDNYLDRDSSVERREEDHFFHAEEDTVLDGAQRRAVSLAMDRFPVVACEGASGTGKTRVAVDILARWGQQKKATLSRKCYVLCVASSDLAVDRLLEDLLDRGLRAIRVGEPLVSGLAKYGLGGEGRWRDDVDVRVVCATRAGVGARLLQTVAFDRVLIDEADCLEDVAAIAPVTRGCDRLVVLGETHHHSDASLFGRVAKRLKAAVATLSTLHRFHHPALAAFASLDEDDTTARSSPRGKKERLAPSLGGVEWPRPDLPIAFVPLAKEGEGVSETLAAVARALLEAGLPASDLGVVTADGLEAAKFVSLLPEDVDVAGVDRFRGLEKKVVIVAVATLGCLAGDERRARLALTRARDALILIGDARALYADEEVWRPKLDWLCQQGAVLSRDDALALDGASTLPIRRQKPLGAGWDWLAPPPPTATEDDAPASFYERPEEDPSFEATAVSNHAQEEEEEEEEEIKVTHEDSEEERARRASKRRAIVLKHEKQQERDRDVDDYARAQKSREAANRRLEEAESRATSVSSFAASARASRDEKRSGLEDATAALDLAEIQAQRLEAQAATARTDAQRAAIAKDNASAASAAADAALSLAESAVQRERTALEEARSAANETAAEEDRLLTESRAREEAEASDRAAQDDDDHQGPSTNGAYEEEQDDSRRQHDDDRARDLEAKLRAVEASLAPRLAAVTARTRIFDDDSGDDAAYAPEAAAELSTELAQRRSAAVLTEESRKRTREEEEDLHKPRDDHSRRRRRHEGDKKEHKKRKHKKHSSKKKKSKKASRRKRSDDDSDDSDSDSDPFGGGGNSSKKKTSKKASRRKRSDDDSGDSDSDSDPLLLKPWTY